MSLPIPEFQIGEQVRVVPNERHQTLRIGFIDMVIWHHKDQRYNFYIREQGKKVSTRYLADDLAPESHPAST